MVLPKLVKVSVASSFGCKGCRLFVACPDLTPKCVMLNEETKQMEWYIYEEKETK